MSANRSGLRLFVDVGTTNIKVYAGCSTYSAPTPAAGSRVDMDRLWQAVASVIKEAVSRHHADDVFVISQGDGLWPLDENFRPVGPAFTWQETASAGCGADSASPACCNGVFPGSRIVLLSWLKKEKPDFYNKIVHPLQLGSFINFKLTGKLFEDTTNAAANAYDIVADARLIGEYERFGLSDMVPKLPPVCSPFDIIGTVTHKAAEETGLPLGTKVLGGCVDAVYEVLKAELQPGEISMTVGTSMIAALCSEEPLPLEMAAFRVKNPLGKGYLNFMGAAAGGCAIEHARQLFMPGSSMEEALAAAKTAGECNPQVIPYINGERAPFNAPPNSFFVINGEGERPESLMYTAVSAVACHGALLAESLLGRKAPFEYPPRTVISGGAGGELFQSIYEKALKDENGMLSRFRKLVEYLMI